MTNALSISFSPDATSSVGDSELWLKMEQQYFDPVEHVLTAEDIHEMLTRSRNNLSART